MTADNNHYYVALTKLSVASEIRQAPIKPTINLTDSYTGMKFVNIKQGCFQMGSPENEDQRDNDERQHRVCIKKDYALGQYEVTQAQWEKVMGSNPSYYKGRNKPVETVSWDDIQDFISKLNQQTGLNYRLPTEAEWEYAARAGTTTPFYTGHCINTDQANYNGNYDYNNCGAKTGVYKSETVSVGLFPANPWGLYDMAGNVWEWTCSEYDGSYAGGEHKCLSKKHANKDDVFVLRGGSFSNTPPNVRVANRHRNRSWERNVHGGLSFGQDLLTFFLFSFTLFDKPFSV